MPPMNCRVEQVHICPRQTAERGKMGQNGRRSSMESLSMDVLPTQGDHHTFAASLRGNYSVFWAFELRPGGS